MSDNTEKSYELHSLHVDGNTLTADITVPADVPYFDGHFDGFPVLPGVAQVHWAIELAVNNFGIKGGFSSIDVLKFMRVIQPNDRVTLIVMYNDDKMTMDFQYTSADTTHSKGKVRFGA